MGCKTSKDAGQPKSIAGGQPKTSEKDSTTPLTQSPEKVKPGQTPIKTNVTPSKPIKEISNDQLKKQKVSDIITFAKQGNLAMVHGLINYFALGQSAILLKSGNATDEFTMSKEGPKVSTAQWNPFLVAIANKKLEIVKYFLHDLNISIATSGVSPDLSMDARFALKIAVAN